MGIYIDAALELIKQAGRKGDIRRGKANADAGQAERASKAKAVADAKLTKELEFQKSPVEALAGKAPKATSKVNKLVDWQNLKGKDLEKLTGKVVPKAPDPMKLAPEVRPFGEGILEEAAHTAKKPSLVTASNPLHEFGAGILEPHTPPVTPKAPVTPTSAAAGPAAGTVPPVVPAATEPHVPFTDSPLGWANSFRKRNPEGALLGLAGAGLAGGAGLYGLYNMYANRKLKERQAAKSGLNPGTLKAAMHKLGITSMAAPTALSAATPLPQPQVPQAGAIQSNVPNAPRQQPSSTSVSTTGQTPAIAVTDTARQNAAAKLPQLQGAEQQDGSGQAQGGQQ